MDCRSFKNDKQNYGPKQIEWLKSELKNANTDESIKGVFILHSWPWKTKREWKSKTNKNHT